MFTLLKMSRIVNQKKNIDYILSSPIPALQLFVLSGPEQFLCHAFAMNLSIMSFVQVHNRYLRFPLNVDTIKKC